MKRHWLLDALCRLQSNEWKPRLPAMRTICCPAKLTAILAFAIAATFELPTVSAQVPSAWPPVPPEELALKDNAFDPGSPAMILEYEVQSDNTKATETIYKRKIGRASCRERV